MGAVSLLVDERLREAGVMMDPYKVNKAVVDELNIRARRKLHQVFPEKVPPEIITRLKREEAALLYTPYTYALLIVDEAIKEFRKYRFKTDLSGGWCCCYYAWLLNLIDTDPTWLAKYYQSFGWKIKQLVRDKCIEEPMEIAVSPGWAKPACLELLRLRANEWGFYLWECPEGWKLISISHRPDDLYAAYAPIVRVVDDD